MIDQIAHVEGVVKDELAKVCAKLGIDKGEAGYWVAGHGALLPVPDQNGGVGFTPAWWIGISLRHKLVGYKPVAANVPALGVLPDDAKVREIVNYLMTEINQRRDQEFNGQAVPSKPGLAVVAGK